MRIVFAFTGALFVLNVYRLTGELFGHRSGLWAAGLSAVFPYWIYFSIIFYRDMLTMFVLSQVLYSLIHLGRSCSMWNLSKTLVFVIVSIILRPENILPIGVAFLVAGFVVIRGWRGSIKATFLTGIGAIMSAVVPWVGFDFSINITRLAA